MEKQELNFTGVFPIKDILNDHPRGSIFEFVRWQNIINARLPTSDYTITSLGARIAIENLQLIYYLPDLWRVPADQLPQTDPEINTETEMLLDYSEFQRSYTPVTGHAIEVQLMEFAPPSTWRPVARKWFYNTGLENSLNLIYPWLTDGQVAIQGIDSVLGIAVTRYPESLNLSNSYIRLRGTFSISVDYYISPLVKQYEENSGSILLGLTPERILFTRNNRVGLILTNNSTDPIYFKFSNTGTANTDSPTLKPKGSLILMNGLFKKSDIDKADLFEPFAPFANTFALNVLGTKTNQRISWQEFYG